MIKTLGIAWNHEHIQNISKQRAWLIVLIRILAIILFILSGLALAAVFFTACLAFDPLLLFTLLFSGFLLMMLPFRGKFEAILIRMLWHWSSHRIIHKTLSHIRKEPFELCLDETKLVFGNILVEKATIRQYTESPKFFLLLTCKQAKYLPKPRFMFIRNTPEIRPALLQILT
ncbi:MAG: hypothetical protein R3A45_03670 [Bdellovibrionota bacterium]